MVDAIHSTNQALLHNTAVERVQQTQQGSPEVQHHLFSKQLNAQEELKRSKVSDAKQIEGKSVDEKNKKGQGSLTGKKKRNNQTVSEEENKLATAPEQKAAEGEEPESRRHIDIRV